MGRRFIYVHTYSQHRALQLRLDRVIVSDIEFNLYVINGDMPTYLMQQVIIIFTDKYRVEKRLLMFNVSVTMVCHFLSKQRELETMYYIVFSSSC